MVGVVALKNFQTGSYRYMRISVFKGDAYSDIEKGELISSYIVDPDANLAVLELSGDANCFVPLDKVVFVSRSAREFFYNNTHATQLEFKTNGDDIYFRISGTKCGVSEPASFRELFGDDSLYMLISDEKEHTYMWRSALCDAMNFVVQKAFDVSEEVYTHSGGGIYINLALFSPRMARSVFKDIDRDVYKRLTALRKKRIGSLKLCPLDKTKKPMPCGYGYRSETVYLYRRLKHEAYTKTFKEFAGLSDKEILLRLKSFPSNYALRECADSFTKDALDCITNCFKYSNIKHESYKDMISARELLYLTYDATWNISGILSARSSNLKFLKHLPCAKYLLSDATAYWDRRKE